MPGLHGRQTMGGMDYGMSRSEKKIMSALAMTHGICLRLRDRYQNVKGCKSIKKRIDELDSACDNAYRLWAEQFDAKTLKRMLSTCLVVDRECLGPDNGETMTTVVMTSLSLGMMSDVLDHVRDPRRTEALLWVHDAMMRVHKYFDTRMDRMQHYATATNGIAAWHRVMEAA